VDSLFFFSQGQVDLLLSPRKAVLFFTFPRQYVKFPFEDRLEARLSPPFFFSFSFHECGARCFPSSFPSENASKFKSGGQIFHFFFFVVVDISFPFCFFPEYCERGFFFTLLSPSYPENVGADFRIDIILPSPFFFPGEMGTVFSLILSR